MQAFSFRTLQLELVSEGILLLTLNRPKVRNAINSEMMRELHLFWQQMNLDAGQVRCVILTGKDQAFCAGADLKERNALTLSEWQKQRRLFEQGILSLIQCSLPIIAAVNGAAFGGGLELILACDFAYGATNATFAQPEVKVGLIPGILGTQNLPRACGVRRAKELTYTGETFSAQEAEKWGILNKLCEPATLMDEVLAVARKMAENAPLAIAQAKKSLNQSQNLDIFNGYAFECEAYNQLLHTKDREEGIRSFNERRKPSFVGE